MALAIRLTRGGRKNRPHYKIVVADKRMPRDGRFLEKVGTYDPLLTNDNENRVVFNAERVKYWLSQGAQPSDRVARMMAQAGLGDAVKWNESPKKSAPKAKTVERLKEKEEKRKAAEEAAAAPAEEAPAAEAPAEEAAPAAEGEAQA
jgi:small subunit ribosomal protein S16